MHVFFPWDSCNHSYHSLQPKDTANWCLPHNQMTSYFSLKKKSIQGVFKRDLRNEIGFPLFKAVDISKTCAL